MILRRKASILLASFFALTLMPSWAMTVYDVKTQSHGYTDVYKRSPYYSLQKATHLADLGHCDQAVPLLKASLEKNPTSVIAQYNLGYCLLEAAINTASQTQQQHMLDEAEWAFLRTRDLNPDLSMTYYKLGKLATAREDYQTALAYYESGVDSHPNNVGLLFNLAATQEKLNDLDGAEKTYLQAIAANAKFVYAHNNLGLLYEQKQMPDKAEAIYRQALAEVPEYNYARLNLGSLLQGEGRLEEAAAIYTEVITLEPDNAWGHLYLGNVYYRQGNFKEALTYYKNAINLKPDYPTTYYLASLALQKLNRNDEALSTGLQYINLAPHGAFSQEAGEMVMTLQQAKKQANLQP